MCARERESERDTGLEKGSHRKKGREADGERKRTREKERDCEREGERQRESGREIASETERQSASERENATQGPSNPQSKVIFGRFRQLLVINAHEMAPRTRRWLQERGRDTPTKGLLWYLDAWRDHVFHALGSQSHLHPPNVTLRQPHSTHTVSCQTHTHHTPVLVRHTQHTTFRARHTQDTVRHTQHTPFRVRNTQHTPFRVKHTQHTPFGNVGGTRRWHGPPPLGSTQVPRHRAAVGSYGGGVACKRGTTLSLAHTTTHTLVFAICRYPILLIHTHDFGSYEIAWGRKQCHAAMRGVVEDFVFVD